MLVQPPTHLRNRETISLEDGLHGLVANDEPVVDWIQQIVFFNVVDKTHKSLVF